MRILNYLVVSVTMLIIITPAIAADQACEGRRAWLRYNCAGCHGARATGGMGPNIENASSGAAQGAMMGGQQNHGMRSYSNTTIKDVVSPNGLLLNSNQISNDAKNIAAYLQTVKNSNAKLIDHADLPGIKIPDTSNEPTFVDWWKKVPLHNMLDAYTPKDIAGIPCSFTLGE